MNRNSRSSRFLRPSPAAPRRRRSRGFALVVTLSLMVLLALLAVGLLSLSSVALRGSSQEMAMAEARANARLAMMLAIGELQKELGPDQRISAPSAILDSDPQSPSLEGVTQGHLTGVWSARNDALGTTPDYSRTPSFRRWLVSNADPTKTKQLDWHTTDPAPNSANLFCKSWMRPRRGSSDCTADNLRTGDWPGGPCCDERPPAHECGAPDGTLSP